MSRNCGFSLLIVLAACSDAEPSSAPAASVTDSAGIRAVRNAPADRLYAELVEAPILSIGEFSGPSELLFGRVASVSRDQAGNIIVADAQAFEVRVFDPQGQHVLSFGQEGGGPGDFQSLDAVWPLEDGSLLAVDDRLDRISRFDMNGRLIETATLENNVELSANVFRPGGPGMVLSYANPPPSFESVADIDFTSADDFTSLLFAGEANRRVLFVRHSLDGSLVDTVAEGKQAGIASVPTGSGGSSLFPVPFSSESAMAISTHGIAFVVGAAFEVQILDPDGTPHTIARIDEHPPARTDELLEEFVRGSRPNASDATLANEIERRRAITLPDSLPGYVDVLLGLNGESWAKRFTMPGADSVRWDVFRPDGMYVGRVMLPASFQLWQVGHEDVLGVARDEYGVERVLVVGVRYRR
ncbi:MAG: 6-bladed beta-propeller [Gemmatimonadetes bacterium]|nr:6-bladed beta-propeller [Gemmatimonadota bacterium]MCY3610272.1 6-bladed beta-propeller [Gemmatimonadota bacterium]MCY3677137.1 6-bladed beta-propeller [Gemmatimonadota bacterium]MYA40653.1 hypothetical protein [Gemmatimonadota bacterium]MYE93724.1 hypothetical protein [Gemmatimonadota bacterium]